MHASSAAKGKARAIDPDVSQGNEQANGSNGLPASQHANGRPSTRTVKPQPIPAATLLNIEYPGILVEDPSPSVASSSSYTSLDRALSTLHPSALPPLTSSPYEALNFLSKIPNEGLRVVECRLGGFPDSSNSVSTSSIDEVYRSPLIGEAVPTHNIVIRVVKRTWRQKKRKRPPSPTPPGNGNDIVLDPALLAETDPSHVCPANGHATAQKEQDRCTGRVKKEYRVEVLGMATHTVRFRSMADFAFQPQVSASSSSTQLDPVMALHKALATMDLEVFQNFRIPAQLEDYQLPQPNGEPPKSNLHMVPPAFFSRMDVPFNYAFQQTPYSELRTVPTPPHLTKTPTSKTFSMALHRPDIPAGQMQRFVNRVRLTGITPQPFRVGSRDVKVPTKPQADVEKIRHRCDPTVLTRLRELMEERPVWSRVALKNQLSDTELKELQGNNEKVYYALVGYAMVGGPWRDTVVRFGYDVREDRSSRIYQRLFLRGGPAGRETRLSAQGSDKRVAEDGPEEDDAEEEHAAARSTVVPIAPTKRSKVTHLFDGETLHRNVGNFHLCDIHDPLIKPFIDLADRPYGDALVEKVEGIEWVRETFDPETGWYTRRALELIRALVGARFKALTDTGRPLREEAVAAIVERLRGRWMEEDLGPQPVRQEAEEEIDDDAPAAAGNSVVDPALM